MSHKFTGQWQGVDHGGSSYLVNIDLRRGKLHGKISIFSSLPIDGTTKTILSWYPFVAPVKPANKMAGKTFQPTFHSRNGELLTQEEISYIKSEVPEIEFPESVSFEGELVDDNTMDVTWNYSFQSRGTQHNRVTLSKNIRNKSRVIHEEMSWNQFKAFVRKRPEGTIYRGQGKQWPLQTSFHRFGGADLSGYLVDSFERKSPIWDSLLCCYVLLCIHAKRDFIFSHG